MNKVVKTCAYFILKDDYYQPLKSYKIIYFFIVKPKMDWTVIISVL